MSKTTLNTQILLRRAAFEDSCVLALGEPGYHTGTKVFKIGDGVTTWKDLPFANKEEVDEIVSGYKPLQTAIEAVETAANTFVDKISQDANGVITITTKAVDFSADDARSKEIFKQLQTKINAVATNTNVFVDTIAQDEQGVITITTKAVDFSAYRTAANQDEIDKTFKTKQAVYTATGSTLKTLTKITQDANGEIEATFTDIATGEVAENETALTTGDTVYDAIEAAKAELKGTKAEGDNTAETIAGAKAYADARKAEVVSMIDGVASAGLTRSIVTELPDPATAAMNTIYMIRRTNNLNQVISDVYDEYILVEVNGVKQFELLGNTELDLTGYATEGYVDDTIGALDNDCSNADASKTISVLKQEDGKISATYQKIAITKDQITDFVEQDYKTKQDAVSDPTAEGYETSFIDTISQDENGKITVTKKSVDFSNYYTKEEADDADDNTTYIVAPTDTPLQFTVTPSEGEVQTVTLVGPDVGVTKVEAGLDIVVTPETGTGVVTVSHKEFGTGEYTKSPENSTKTGDTYMMTGVTVNNGHVTGASVQSLAHALEALTIVLDGGTSATTIQ